MANNGIKKGIIPAAGLGTRLFPATKILKKEFFPIIDRHGRTKPVILAIVEELLSAGLEEIGIIIQKSDRPVFEEFFKASPKPELSRKLSAENRDYSDYLQEIGQKITFIVQEQPEGFGHAVFCARDWLDNAPFLLSLGDHVYDSEGEKSCAKQLVELYEKINKSLLGLTLISCENLYKAGVVTGSWQENKFLGYGTSSPLLTIHKIWEKPTVEEAYENLTLQGIPENHFLAVFGLYILTPKIFDYLEEEIHNNCRYRGEFQLTTSLDKLCQNEGLMGYRVQGQAFDTGMPEFYRETIIKYGK